jgi:hypothetical protein
MFSPTEKHSRLVGRTSVLHLFPFDFYFRTFISARDLFPFRIYFPSTFTSVFQGKLCAHIASAVFVIKFIFKLTVLTFVYF